jgi:hypothetical protein
MYFVYIAAGVAREQVFVKLSHTVSNWWSVHNLRYDLRWMGDDSLRHIVAKGPPRACVFVCEGWKSAMRSAVAWRCVIVRHVTLPPFNGANGHGEQRVVRPRS